MSSLETKYHELLDVVHEAAEKGDVSNVLRIGDLADAVHEAAVLQGYLPASSYRHDSE